MLTAVNLALRLSSMGFQVYLSGQIGAAGIGLLQLTLSVVGFAMTIGMAGIRTATMYLTADAVGSGRKNGVSRVLSACFVYSFLFSAASALLLFRFAPRIAAHWVGDCRTEPAIRTYAAFLPAVCLGSVMAGYFTATGRIRDLVRVEVLEQLVSMGVTVLLLTLWAGGNAGKSCTSVIMGSGVGSLVTLVCLMGLRKGDSSSLPEGREAGLVPRLLKVALPLALADNLRMGISTVENLIVPRRLALFPGSEPLAAFGRIAGMVFPTIMFPAALLYALAELMIPELARCAAGGKTARIQNLTAKSLRLALLYGLAAGGILFTAAENLGLVLFGSPEVGTLLRWFSILVPMLYVDAIVDANVKGMGQQVASVRYNTITSLLDVVFLWILLPRYGLTGYYLSFAVTHAINFLLSLSRLVKVTGLRPSFWLALRGVLSWAMGLGIASFLPRSHGLGGILFSGSVFLLIFGLLLGLMGVLGKEDLKWLRRLVIDKHADPKI